MRFFVFFFFFYLIILNTNTSRLSNAKHLLGDHLFCTTAVLFCFFKSQLIPKFDFGVFKALNLPNCPDQTMKSETDRKPMKFDSIQVVG